MSSSRLFTYGDLFLLSIIGILVAGVLILVYNANQKTSSIIEDCTPTQMVVRRHNDVLRVYDCGNAELVVSE